MRAIVMAVMLIAPIVTGDNAAAVVMLDPAALKAQPAAYQFAVGQPCQAILAIGAGRDELAPVMEVASVQVGLTYPAALQFVAVEQAEGIAAPTVATAGRALTITLKPESPGDSVNMLGAVRFRCYAPVTGAVVAITSWKITYTNGEVADALAEAINPDRMDITRAKAQAVLRVTP